MSNLPRRYLFLLALLCVEVAALSIWLDTPAEGRGALRLLSEGDVISRIGIVFFAAAGYQLLHSADAPFAGAGEGYAWWPWLAAHATLFAPFLLAAGWVLGADQISSHALALWLLTGVLAALAIVFCFLPPAAVLALLRRRQRLLLLSLAAAVAAWALGKALQHLWKPLAEGSFALTYQLLRPVPIDVSYDAAEGLIGTERLLVRIAPECSGYEGIGLVIVFVSLYLYLFRADLRLSRAWLLFPAGVAAIYVANSVRIAALILIGHFHSAESAVRAFHSQAGWTLFTLISLGLIVASRAVPALQAHHPRRPPSASAVAVEAGQPLLAAALLVPLLVWLGAGMISATVPGQPLWAAAAALAVTAAALWAYAGTYRRLRWAWSWRSIAIGVVVFLAWMALVGTDAERDADQAEALAAMGGGAAAGWIAMRLAASILIAPVVEELAFRGYLLRKIIAADFAAVPEGRLTWLSLLASSAAFGLLHENWLAGALAGAGYAAAQTDSRSIGGAVVAHAVSNGLIAVVAVFGQRWSLWQ